MRTFSFSFFNNFHTDRNVTSFMSWEDSQFHVGTKIKFGRVLQIKVEKKERIHFKSPIAYVVLYVKSTAYVTLLTSIGFDREINLIKV